MGLPFHMIVTNLFSLQSFLARKSLDSQLQKMGALSSSESISISDSINDIFKKCKLILMKIYCQQLDCSLHILWLCLAVWIEHGDELSLEYAGSYALKGDLVR